MKELLSDSLKFQVTGLNNDNILRNLTNVRASFKDVLKTLKSKGKISQQMFYKLDPVGCKPGILYGLSTCVTPVT